MMIALGSDHGGYDLKVQVMKHLEERGIEYKDFGCFDKSSCDYPEFGQAAARAVAEGACEKGIVICTTGIGISIAANKIRGVRCALCTDAYLAMGGGFTGPNLAMEIVDAFLDTEFSKGENHIRRIAKIES